MAGSEALREGGRRGILLTAFGSNNRQGASALGGFERQVRERFPDLAVRWAFTSLRMRERLASARKKSDSVGKALRRMAFEGFSQVALQPLHVVPGLEYLDIVEEIRGLEGDCRVQLGDPLLCDEGDSVDRTAEALLASLPSDRQPDEAVLWMGHGSRHASSVRYERLSENLGRRDARVLVGTMNGEVRLENLFEKLRGARRVWLVPLLALVGRHALEDMAGAGSSSWRSRLEAEGFRCQPVLRGLVEAPAVSRLWLDHLSAAMR